MSKSSHFLRFEDKFIISTICLRATRAHPEVTRDRFWQFQFFLIFTPPFCDFCLLWYTVIYHDLKLGEFESISKDCTMIIVFITVTLKYMSLVLHQESIKGLIKFLENDYREDNNYSDEDKDTVLKYAKTGANVCTFWLLAGYGTTIIFPIKAFVSMGYKYWQGEFEVVPMFELKYPEPVESHKNDPGLFCLFFFVATQFGLYASTMYVGFDPLIPIFMLHVCGQLEILSRRLGKIFIEDKDPKEIKIKLKAIITKQQQLYELMDTIKSNFSVIYEYMMKATTFLLPLTAFQIIASLRNNWINLEFISLFVATILHFFVPAYYSDLLMDMSDDFREAIYSSGWEKCADKGVHKIILFMITRARIPMGIKTVFYEINLDLFAELCRQSYGILNLMNAAWT